MKKKHMIMTILSILLLMQPLILADSYQVKSNIVNILDDNITTNYVPVKQDIGVGGEEQIKTNYNLNYGFEEIELDGGPSDYNYYGDAYRIANTSYTGLTHTGSYACRLASYGTEQFGAETNLYKNIAGTPYAYLQQGIVMNFWYYMVSNPNVSTGGNLYMRIRCWDNAISTSYYMYYYFDTSYIPSPSGNNVYFNLTSSSIFGIWNFYSRNITTDFISAFGAPSATVYFQYFYIYANSPESASDYTELIIDDISIFDSLAYEWISTNAGFEAGTGVGWSGSNSGIAYIYQTTDHTEGNYALNMTAACVDEGTITDCYIDQNWGEWYDPPLGIYSNQLGDVTISFDWKYTEINPDTNNYAYYYIYGDNGSYYFQLTLFLGDDSDTVPYSNSSGAGYNYVYLEAPGFGAKGVWSSLNIDLYDYLQIFNITNMPFIYSGINVYSGYSAGSITELLIDDFNIIADPVGDPSFEEDWIQTPGNSIISWGQNYDSPYIDFTSDSHSGDNAANLTTDNSAGTINIYRDTSLKVANNLFSDIWWRIDAIGSSNDYLRINLELDYTYELYYILGSGASYSASNGSNYYYFFIEDHNQLGTWNNLDRNIAEDVEIAFGDSERVITEVRIEVYGDSPDATSLIIDDVHFVRDTTGPQLISALLLNTPTYYQTANMEIFAVDTLSRVSSILIYYRADTTWEYTTATLGGMYFYASIPAQDFGVIVDYYFVMTDMFGVQNTDDNGGAYYTYEIVDDIDPYVSILSISTSADYGLAEINLDCGDAGSGIDFVEILDNGTLVTTITDAPFIYEWDSAVIQESGLHVITAVAHDVAGNTAEASFDIYVTVYQPPGLFRSFFQTWGTLVGAGIIGTAWVTVTIVQFFRKR